MTGNVSYSNGLEIAESNENDTLSVVEFLCNKVEIQLDSGGHCLVNDRIKEVVDFLFKSLLE